MIDQNRFLSLYDTTKPLTREDLEALIAFGKTYTEGLGSGQLVIERARVEELRAELLSISLEG